MPVTAPTDPTSRRDRHAVAARFLTALAGEERADELLELRYRLDDGYRMGQVFARPSRARGLATRAGPGPADRCVRRLRAAHPPARRARRGQARLCAVGRLRRL